MRTLNRNIEFRKKSGRIITQLQEEHKTQTIKKFGDDFETCLEAIRKSEDYEEYGYLIAAIEWLCFWAKRGHWMIVCL